MSTIRKLSAFRQLSLNCESPISEQRRKSFRKQLSVDGGEEFDQRTKEIKISLSANKRPMRSIKIAWEEETRRPNEGVIVTKCKEIRRQPPGRPITRRGSLEKDSILYSKQELTGRLRDAFNIKNQESKTNIKIFLAHNTREENQEDFDEEENEVPKLIQPLMTVPKNDVFQIRRNRQDLNPSTTPKPSAVVVIPTVEKSDLFELEDPKPIENVVIRPSTAAARRERFQKRTNSAFNSMIKDEKSNRIRPPLIRSLSAPTRADQNNKGKFLATKRKIKSGKTRTNTCNKEPVKSDLIVIQSDEEENSNKENPKTKREMNRFVPTVGVDIVTMVSLISPSASDNEEIEETKPKSTIFAKPKSPVKTPAIIKNHKDEHKNISLRKTVKSVSFQQSSIHAVRSFSSSFPARRSSMATALMLGTAASLLKSAQKLEKRPEPSSPEDERGPKRRLVRSTAKSLEGEEINKLSTSEKAENPEIAVEIKDKVAEEPEEEEDKTEIASSSSSKGCNSDDQLFGSANEKQCWEMYRKMTSKGLTVSYDTILRGMLTPTEYRMRKKDSIDENPQANAVNE